MSNRFTPEELRASADGCYVVDFYPPHDKTQLYIHNRPVAEMLRQAADDAEALEQARAERDEARAIARRWHDTTREIDGEFYSLRSQALDELLADAIIIAGWKDAHDE